MHLIIAIRRVTNSAAQKPCLWEKLRKVGLMGTVPKTDTDPSPGYPSGDNCDLLKGFKVVSS